MNISNVCSSKGNKKDKKPDPTTKYEKPMSSMEEEASEKKDVGDYAEKIANRTLSQEEKDILRNRRAQKLSDNWEKALKELTEIEKYTQQLIGQYKAPDKCTFEEMMDKGRVVSIYTCADRLKATMNSIFEKLRGFDTYFRSVAIVASAALQEQVEVFIQEVEEGEIGVKLDNLKLINEEVKVEMANVKFYSKRR